MYCFTIDVQPLDAIGADRAVSHWWSVYIGKSNGSDLIYIGHFVRRRV